MLLCLCPVSKELDHYYGEYAGVTKLDRESALAMRKEIESMVDGGYYDQWYENALVQMIFRDDFELFYTDISTYDWTEVDNVSMLLCLCPVTTTISASRS